MCRTAQGLGLSLQGFRLPSSSCDVPRAPGSTCRGLGGGSQWHKHRRMFPQNHASEAAMRGSWQGVRPRGTVGLLVLLWQEVGEGHLLGWMDR